MSPASHAAQRRRLDPRTLMRRLRGDLDWVTMKALEKDRTRRYASASDLAADIQRYLSNEPVVAGPPSAIYQFRKLMSRHKAPFTFGAALFAVLLTFGIWMTVLYAHAGANLARARNAEKAEAAEAQNARLEAEKARHIQTFLESLLSSIDPATALGRDTTILREMLDDAAERVATELVDRPEVAIAIQGTIGRTYYSIAEYEKAAVHLEDALAVSRRLFGDEHVTVATLKQDMAVVCCDVGDLDKAERLCREALATFRARLGERNEETAQCLNNLAHVFDAKGRYKDAKALHAESLELRRALFGDKHVKVAEGLNDLGSTVYLQGDFEQAAPHMQEALAILREESGPAHPSVIAATNNLALILGSLGKETRRSNCSSKTSRRSARCSGRTSQHGSGAEQPGRSPLPSQRVL